MPLPTSFSTLAQVHFSVLDLFTIGVGPSSSHTVGPMRAAARFVESLGDLPVTRLRCDLYGSLAATGKGHSTDTALLLGFLGHHPESVPVAEIQTLLNQIRTGGTLTLPNGRTIPFNEKADLDFKRLKPLPRHPNGMHFQALDENDTVLREDIIYSMGGGFIASEHELDHPPASSVTEIPFPYDSGAELLAHCEATGQSIAELTLANEAAFRPENETRERFDAVWAAMQECVNNGCSNEGLLPGGLKISRRAHKLHQNLCNRNEAALSDPLAVLDWVNLYALAVNEENAAGGRVVTAPTNGAAGIIPAVLHYATRFRHSPHGHPVHRFLLTAGAIATLYKKNASLSGADVGCQGEVGVACSMAAGALVEFLGGTPQQVENAAEIGMEHNLGLTCDPVGGLVQIPCIERNAMGSVKAINAARLAMTGDGSHYISLDKVIRTMLDTGRDMKSKYKETSRGGLAVNVVEC
ncbi:MAG: L-serine ammonia-lyase [Akkermansiaceae bacterium]|nr:L-serine ammonia-lyase [Akkermansiaceae bacterium]